MISELQKRYGDLKVLDHINLKIEKGEIYGLIGLSGAGKSTLLRCINGLVPYDAGVLNVKGVEISKLKHSELRKFRKNIGMIFQNFSLLERLDVYENIAFPMRIWKCKPEETDRQVKKTIKLVGLEDKLKSRPRELSGGQKQRIAIARALVMNPDILLCDEATSALDPKTGKSILNLLKEINKQLGITIILVTHQMEVIEQVCDQMALLQNGRIVVDGKVEDVFLKNPEPLQELLGRSEGTEKKSGCFFHVLADENSGYRNLFSRLARETDVNFEVISGGIREFKNGKVFLGVLKIRHEEREKVEKYLKERRIRFEVWENEK